MYQIIDNQMYLRHRGLKIILRRYIIMHLYSHGNLDWSVVTVGDCTPFAPRQKRN